MIGILAAPILFCLITLWAERHEEKEQWREINRMADHPRNHQRKLRYAVIKK